MTKQNKESIIKLIKGTAEDRGFKLTDQEIKRAYMILIDYYNPKNPNNGQDFYDRVKEYFNNIIYIYGTSCIVLYYIQPLNEGKGGQ